jgi:putative redox protein
MQVEVTFPSSTRIQARSRDLTVEVGPPPDRGGDPDAYGPFDLLLCSLATCTGFQVCDFLQQRGLGVEDAGVRIDAVRSERSHLLEAIHIEIRVPADFPEKYTDAIVRAADLCFVKQQLGHKPDITTTVAAPSATAPGSPAAGGSELLGGPR